MEKREAKRAIKVIIGAKERTRKKAKLPGKMRIAGRVEISKKLFRNCLNN